MSDKRHFINGITVTEHAIRMLSRAFEADPQAIHALVCNHVPCNDKLADDPSIVVDGNRVVDIDGKPCYTVGALGLLNGLLNEVGAGVVAVKFEPIENSTSVKIVGFQKYEPQSATIATVKTEE